jgi:diamine N-acetyltransferase
MPMPLLVTEATEAEAVELSELSIRTYVAAFGADFDDPSDLEHHLATSLSVDAWRGYLAHDRVFVARASGRAVGYLQAGRTDTPDEFEIKRVYVDPSRQRQGIGALLLRHALNDPEIASATQLRLDVWQDNRRAQDFYRRFGFAMTEERRPFVLKSGRIDGYDLVMVRHRSPA